MVYQFITTPPISQYFSDLVLGIRRQCTHLDALVHATEYDFSIQKFVSLVNCNMVDLVVIFPGISIGKLVDFDAV